MEKINGRKAQGQGDGAREEPWKKRNFRGRREREEREADEQVDEGGNGRDTSGEERGAREKRTGGVGRLLCKEDIAFFSRVSVRFIPHSKAL